MVRSCSQPAKQVNTSINNNSMPLSQTNVASKQQLREKPVQYLPCSFVYPYTSNLSNTSLSMPSLNENLLAHHRQVSDGLEGSLPMRKLSRLSNLCWVSSVSQPDLTTTVTTISPANSLPTSRASSPVPPSISARGSYNLSPVISPMGSNSSIQSGHHIHMGSNGSVHSNSGHHVVASSSLPRTSSRVASPVRQRCGGQVYQMPHQQHVYQELSYPPGVNNGTNTVQLSEVDGSQYNMRSNDNFTYNIINDPVNNSMITNQQQVNYNNLKQTGNQMGFAQNLVYLTEDGSILPVKNFSEPSTVYYQQPQPQINNINPMMDPYYHQQQQHFYNNNIPEVNQQTSRRRSSLLYRVQRRSISPKPVSEQLKPCAVIPPNSVIDSDPNGAKSKEYTSNSPTFKEKCSGATASPQKTDVGTSCEDLSPHNERSLTPTGVNNNNQQPYPFVVETCQICNVFSPASSGNYDELNCTLSSNNNIPYFSYTPCLYGTQIVLLKNQDGQAVVYPTTTQVGPASPPCNSGEQMTSKNMNSGGLASSKQVKVIERTALITKTKR